MAPSLFTEDLSPQCQSDVLGASLLEEDIFSAANIGEGWFALPQHYPVDVNDDLSMAITHQNPTFSTMDVESTFQFHANTYVNLEELPDLKKIDLCYYSWSKCNPKSPSEAQKALQHAMWTLAASASVNYWTLRDQLYQHTCQILDSLERQGVHSSTLSIERVQAWLLLAIYELTTFGFRRAWVSAGKAFRLIQLDSSWTAATGLLADDDMHHGKGNHTSWVELEQRRRTFCISIQPTCAHGISSRRKCHALTDRFSVGPKSPFEEFITVATVAGYVLSHRTQVNIDLVTAGGRPDRSKQDDLWDRHVLLDSLVRESMRAFSQHHPRAAQEQEPHLLFMSITWRVITLYLWHIAEAMRPPQKSKHRAIRARSLQQVEGLVHEVLDLMSKLSDLSNWKIHPLMTIPLTLCAELLAARANLLEAFNAKMRAISHNAAGLRLSLTEE
ncbi:hypothetical protein CIB48_g109 [Xylaria polymorpha]|nr:hypothetical protein CIB48_g109 [Xylaria polymorpha]